MYGQDVDVPFRKDRQPVAPGTSGSIKVSFNPQGRPGSFVKSVTVNSNSSTPVISLTLRGNVSRKPMGPYDAYKYTAGPLRLTTSNINFGAIKHTDVAEKNIELINTDTKPVQISFSTPVPNIRTTPTPTTLKKGEKGKITLTYDATAKEEWGFITAPVEINVDGQKSARLQLPYTSTKIFHPMRVIMKKPLSPYSQKNPYNWKT